MRRLIAPIVLVLACSSEPPRDPNADKPYWCYDLGDRACYPNKEQCVKANTASGCKYQEGAACFSAMQVVKGQRATWCVSTMTECQATVRALSSSPDYADVSACEVRR